MEPQSDIEESQVADRISKEFKVNLPGENLPTPVRLIAFFTLIGGLSIIGSLFVDIIHPAKVDVSFFILRTFAGVISIIIAYGIIEHKRWSIWLYALFTIFAVFSNPFLAIIPLGVVVYLYTQREFLYPSVADMYLAAGIEKIKSKFKKNNPTTQN